MQRLMTVSKSKHPASVRWMMRAVIVAIGFAAIPRTGLDSLMQFSGIPTAPRAIAAVEPGLFEFSSMRPPAAPVPETASVQSAPAAPAAKPVPARKTEEKLAQVPGVERFDRCLPNCESRDPALRINPVATGAPVNIIPVSAQPVRAALIPPLPILPGAPTGPGLAERALDAAQAALSGTSSAIMGTTGAVTDKIKALATLNW